MCFKMVYESFSFPFCKLLLPVNSSCLYCDIQMNKFRLKKSIITALKNAVFQYSSYKQIIKLVSTNPKPVGLI